MDCAFSSPGANKIRIIAVICLVFGVIQLGFAGSVSSIVTNEIVGSWWAGTAILLTTLFTGMKATNMCSVVSAAIFGTICIILAVIALIIDGLLSAHFNSLDACISDTSQIYGDANTPVAYCFDPSYSCACTDGSSCWGYDINSGYDCGALLDEVPANLGMSALFALLCAILMTVYSCMACGVSCCPESCGHYDPAHEKEAQANPAAL
jgi:hypothetical protein